MLLYCFRIIAKLFLKYDCRVLFTTLNTSPAYIGLETLSVVAANTSKANEDEAS